VAASLTFKCQRHYEASILLCSHILAAFRGIDVFQLTDHLKVIREVKAELKLRNAAKSESSLNVLASKMSYNNRRTILSGKETGQWLSVLPSTANGMELYGMELSDQEFRDALLLRYDGCPRIIYRSSARAASRSLAFAMCLTVSVAVL
jgi:hypothetical protein